MTIENGLIVFAMVGVWLVGYGRLLAFEKFGIQLLELRQQQAIKALYDQWEQNRITRMKQKLLGHHVSTCEQDDAAQRESYEQQIPTTPPYEHVKNCRFCLRKYFLEGAPLADVLDIPLVSITFSED